MSVVFISRSTTRYFSRPCLLPPDEETEETVAGVHVILLDSIEGKL